MGTKYSYLCPSTHYEQEVIEALLSTTKLAETLLEDNLLKVISCVKGINPNARDGGTTYIMDSLKDYKTLNKNFSISLFNDFLHKILTSKQFFQGQQFYFNMLLAKHDNTQTCFKTIATIVILYSKSTLKDRIDYLHKHILEAYGSKEEDLVRFLTELISLNTDDCLAGITPFFKTSEITYLKNIWSAERKEKLLRHILRWYKKKSPGKPRSYSMGSRNEIKTDLPEQEVISKTRKSRIITDVNKVVEALNMMDEDDNESLLFNFLCMSISELFGEFIRLWMYEDYCQGKNIEKSIL